MNTYVTVSLLYLHNWVPKQTSSDAKLVKFEKFRIYAPRFVRFSVSTTLVFNVLSPLHFLMLINQMLTDDFTNHGLDNKVQG